MPRQHSCRSRRFSPCRRRVRAAFALWAATLCLGCTLIPVDELGEGGSAWRLHFSSAHYPYAEGDIVFSHQTHRLVECKVCHGDSTTPEAIAAGDLPPMATCFRCHDGVTLSRDCETCHQVNRRERKPRFHTGQWITHHRDMAYEEAYKCSLCHVESECQQCHATWKPQSHTLRFIRSTHGRMATSDRRSCATCHQTDFCVNCHSQAPPDHTPAFRQGAHRQVARLKARSCLTCHDFQADCSECHR